MNRSFFVSLALFCLVNTIEYSHATTLPLLRKGGRNPQGDESESDSSSGTSGEGRQKKKKKRWSLWKPKWWRNRKERQPAIQERIREALKKAIHIFPSRLTRISPSTHEEKSTAVDKKPNEEHMETVEDTRTADEIMAKYEAMRQAPKAVLPSGPPPKKPPRVAVSDKPASPKPKPRHVTLSDEVLPSGPAPEKPRREAVPDGYSVGFPAERNADPRLNEVSVASNHDRPMPPPRERVPKPGAPSSPVPLPRRGRSPSPSRVVP